MTSKFMFFCQERGGGTLYSRLLSQSGDDILGTHHNQSQITMLPTAEDIKFYPLYQDVPKIISDKVDPINQPTAYCMYAECWWGLRTIETGPAEPIWGPSMINRWLPRDRWKVISLLRDGRSHVTSKVLGEYINAWNHRHTDQISKIHMISKDQPEVIHDALSNLDEFERNCKFWKAKARMNIRNDKQFPNYYVVRFEDMVKDPYVFLDKILRMCGLTPNLENPAPVKVNTTSIWGQGKHHEVSEQTNRYSVWEDKHYEICRQIMAPELRELGYSGAGID